MAETRELGEADRLVGRVIRYNGLDWTVSSAASEGRYGRVFEVIVRCPETNGLLVFDSIETFNNWAYGTPVSTAGAV